MVDIATITATATRTRHRTSVTPTTALSGTEDQEREREEDLALTAGRTTIAEHRPVARQPSATAMRRRPRTRAPLPILRTFL